MNQLLALLLASAWLLAPSAEAQMKQHTLTAVVDPISGLSGGTFGVVSPGDTVTVTLDVNHDTLGVNFPDELSVTTYWRAVVDASITIGGVTTNPPVVRSWVGVDDDIDNIQFCNDALELRVIPGGAYTELGIDMFVRAAGCPTVPEWQAFPTEFKLTAPQPNTLLTETLFLALETPSGTETLTAIVTSESIVDTARSTEYCTGDGGNQAGCTNCPCTANALAGTLGGCPNSTGSSARITSSGDLSTSLPPSSSNDLSFALQGAPANTLCVLSSGDALAPLGMTNPCFGQGSGVGALQFDGLRCAVLNTRRHGGRFSDPTGKVGATNAPWGGTGGPPVGIAQAGSGFSPGQTRYFQATYRDLTSVGCGRGLNTSQAVEITFEP